MKNDIYKAPPTVPSSSMETEANFKVLIKSNLFFDTYSNFITTEGNSLLYNRLVLFEDKFSLW